METDTALEPAPPSVDAAQDARGDGHADAAPHDGRLTARQPRVAPQLRVAPPDLDDPALYLNRELSWLEFNRRVLAQATDPDVPLLERLRFVSIFASNLDEFFMVRVAGLLDQVEADVQKPTADGLTPAEQVEAISRRLRPLLETLSDTLHEHLLPLLARQGVALRSWAELDADDVAALQHWFEAEVFPVLTPLAVDPGHPFPYISNLSLSLAVTVRDPKDQRLLFARVKVPEVLPRFVALPEDHGWIPMEEVIAANLGRLFPGMDIVEAHPFRITRNADLDVEEDEAEDLLMAIEEELSRRRFGDVVRLEFAEGMPDAILERLQDELGVGDELTYKIRGLLDLEDVDELANLERRNLRWEPWHPVPSPRLQPVDGTIAPARVFEEIRRGDVLVRHPYLSFSATVERFITAASEDAGVLAIKQTLYRTSGDSPIVSALIRAAEAGKQVVALVELKARFDEEANITWARVLEKAGVHVVYGLVGLKTHAKTSLVVRREPDGIRRYVHVGSGNYNPTTARLYTDVGLLTCRPEIGDDVTDLFNFLTGYARQDTYERLLVAPVNLRERCRDLIRQQAERARSGEPARIRLKLNSLVDAELVRELYVASQAGVAIDLVIRGVCCLRPGVPGRSDRIRVRSIVGRFLEHERILEFGDDVFIGSADWMPRNLDRRVEAMAPIDDPQLRDVLRDVLDRNMADNVLGWSLRADGSWVRRYPGDGDERLNSQESFLDDARALRSAAASPPPAGPAGG